MPKQRMHRATVVAWIIFQRGIVKAECLTTGLRLVVTDEEMDDDEMMMR